MSREIKFRVWYPSVNEMIHFSKPYVGFDGVSWAMMLRTVEGHVYMGKSELMQFTGLKDKNGREIYEGDILGTSNNDPEHDMWDYNDFNLTVVEWEKEYARFNGSNWWVNNDEVDVYSIKFVSIVGNIYQNPGLLK